MTDPLWRDDNYEPGVLPSPAELLHPEWANLPPVAGGADGAPPPSPIPEFGPETSAESEPTRFLPRRRPHRYWIAAALTAGVFIAVAVVLAALTKATGPKGIGWFLLFVGTVLVGFATVVGAWRWAGRRTSGIPFHRSKPPIDMEGGRGV